MPAFADLLSSRKFFLRDYYASLGAHVLFLHAVTGFPIDASETGRVNLL
jgi:hypothetical protein